MGRVVMYETVNGEPVERLVAREKTVQRKLRYEAADIAVRAEANLNAAHERTGQSQIVLEHGDWTDWYVVLDDENAMQIEFGHKFKRAEGEQGKPKTARALAPLRRAAGIGGGDG